MESIIKIGEDEVRLKANAVTAIYYKSQFKSDILKDTLNAIGGIDMVAQIQSLGTVDDYKRLQTVIDGFDTVLVYQLVWSFARTADRKFPPFYNWMETADLPPVTDMLLEENFIDLLLRNITRKKK